MIVVYVSALYFIGYLLEVQKASQCMYMYMCIITDL